MKKLLLTPILAALIVVSVPILLFTSCDNTERVGEHLEKYPNTIIIKGKAYRAANVRLSNHEWMKVLVPFDDSVEIPVSVSWNERQGKRTVTETVVVIE